MSIAFRISVFTRPLSEKMQQSDKGNRKSLLKYEKKIREKSPPNPKKKTNKQIIWQIKMDGFRHPLQIIMITAKYHFRTRFRLTYPGIHKSCCTGDFCE